jgi:hypothetical protein
VIIETTRAEYSSFGGDPIVIDIRVLNSGTRECFVFGSSDGCIAFGEILDLHDNRLRFGNKRICDLAAARHRLAPGDSMIDQVQLGGVPPGNYRVRALIGVADHALVWSE